VHFLLQGLLEPAGDFTPLSFSSNTVGSKLIEPHRKPRLRYDPQPKDGHMPIPINDAAFEYLLARAGLTLSDAEKAELRTVCDGIAAMAERVRKPRGRMAEPALTYGFAEEDLQ
jgi:hypothetical protein